MVRQVGEMSGVPPTDTHNFCINQTAQVTVPQSFLAKRADPHYSRPVLITPLRRLVSPGKTLPGVRQLQSLMVDKLILKATLRGGKECKLFVLRNVDLF